MARPGLPAFIAKVADSASRVVCAVGDVTVASGLQERGRPLGLAQHPELVGRPRQRPRHQLGFGQRRRVDLGQHRVGFAAAALPRQRVGQRQPGGQARRALSAARPSRSASSRSPSRSASWAASTTRPPAAGGRCPAPATPAAAGPAAASRRMRTEPLDQLGAQSAQFRSAQRVARPRRRTADGPDTPGRRRRRPRRRASASATASRPASADSIGERQRVLDGQVLQHPVRAGGQLRDESSTRVASRLSSWPGGVEVDPRRADRRATAPRSRRAPGPFGATVTIIRAVPLTASW